MVTKELQYVALLYILKKKTRQGKKMTDKKIPIVELFVSVQGEGTYVGLPTLFIRTGLCSYKCTWCDSEHAINPSFKHEWEYMTCSEIYEQVKELTGNKPCLITLTGGNPAMHNFTELIDIAKADGYTFDMETQGDIYAEWFNKMDHITFSPKPPSSLMKTDWDKLDKCVNETVDVPLSLKVVVGDDTDYKYALDVFKRYPQITEKFMSALNLTPGEPENDVILKITRDMIEKALADKLYDVKFLPQLHVLLWGNENCR